MSSSGPVYPRIAWTATGFATVFVFLAIRLSFLSTSETPVAFGDFQSHTLPAPRGTIWDHKGALLATDAYEYEVGLTLSAAKESGIQELGAKIEPLLGLDRGEFAEKVRTTTNPHQIWIRLHPGVDHETKTKLMEFADKGITTTPFERRVYPLGSASMHLLGMLLMDKSGTHGIEAGHQETLTGTLGTIDGFGGTNPSAFVPARTGMDLRLTIDRDIQAAAAIALEAKVKEEEAEGGSVVVMDAKTGAILASTSYPSFDPNDFSKIVGDELNDPVISEIYEPGSVVKAMTVAAALEAGAIEADSHYQDEGRIEYAGIPINNWDHLPHGWTSVEEMLRHSLNIGAVWVADRLGAEGFYKSMQAFGFGEPSNIELPGEVAGIVNSNFEDEDWYSGNLATNSFGHGISTTPIQIVSAMQAIANDGRRMQAHIIAERIPSTGEAFVTNPTLVREVVSPHTARTVRGMLQSVVDQRVTQAAIPGYSVGGKTGTSQIPIPGGYDEEGTIATFGGFLPAENPQIVILTKVDRPKSIRGSDVAAPLFREVALAAIDALNIPPDRDIATAEVNW